MSKQIEISIKKMPKNENILTNQEFCEQIDAKLLKKIIDSKLTIDYDDPLYGHASEKKQLIAYQKKIKYNKIPVKYTLSEKGKGYGRVTPEKSLSLATIRREVRHTLCKDTYVDVDITNCQPTILCQICESNEIECKSLRKYCDNRESILNDVMKDYNCERSKAKELFIILMNYGKFDTWVNKIEKNTNKKANKFITKFVNELPAIVMKILEVNTDICNSIKVSDKNNLTGSRISRYLQEHESRILQCMILHVQNKYDSNKILTLCSDGFMMLKSKYDSKLLKELEKEVSTKLGFNLNIIEKPMDEDFTEELNKAYEPIDLDPKYTSKFNTDYMESLETYANKKQYFEVFVCKIMRPTVQYMYIEETRCTVREKFSYDMKGIRGAFMHLTDGTEKSFIARWLSDPKMKCFNSMDFKPFNGLVDPNPDPEVFNCFDGYNPLIKTEYKKEDQMKILRPFLDLCTEICEGNKEFADNMLYFFAHLIQKPCEKISKYWCVIGQQGTGKNTFLEAIANVIGKKYYITSSNPDDFFGQYAEGFAFKLIVNMNELEKMQVKDIQGKLKTFVSEDTITLNQKFIRPTTVLNYSRLIQFSNNINGAIVDTKTGDRRTEAVKTTDKYLQKQYNTSFWEKSYAHYRKPTFIAALYDYLNDMDLAKYNMKDRCKSEMYKELCRQNSPTEALFMEKILTDDDYTAEFGIAGIIKESNEVVRIKGSDLYNAYLSWADKNGFHKDYKPDIKQFYCKMQNKEVTSVSVNGYKHLKFVPASLMKYMIKMQWIESEDSFIDEEEIDEGLDKEFEDYF